MTAGQQLASARLDHGWTLEQIAGRLDVSVARIAALENTDAAHLPSRIFVRDLVGEYAREVGLDPQQLEASYLAELDARAGTPHATSSDEPSPPVAKPEANSGPRVPARRPAPVSAAGPATVSPAAPAPVRPAAAAPPRSDPPAADPPSAPAPGGAPATRRHPVQQAPRQDYEPNVDILSSLRIRAAGQETPPPRHRRRGTGLRFVAGAVAGLAGIAALLYAGGVDISRVGGGFGGFAERPDDRLPRTAPAGDLSSASERSVEDPDAAEPPRAEIAPTQPAAADERHASTPASAETDRGSPPGGAPPVDPPLARPVAESDGADEPAARDPAAAHAPDVNGPWFLTNRVEAADYSRFRNLTLGFRLTLKQRGTRVVGEGYKYSENGKLLPSRRRTSIALKGHVEGERVVLNFTERGAARTSAGRCVLHMADDGSLRGRFTSNAAGSSGSSIAIRQRRGG